MEEHTLTGFYKLEATDNVYDYLKGLGVALVPRKMQAVDNPTCKITYDQGTNQWKIVLASILKRTEVVFTPGEKFSDETFDFRKCQSSVEVLGDGRIMNWLQTCDHGPDVEKLMGVTDTGFTMILKSGELTCEFKFKRISDNEKEVDVYVKQPKVGGGGGVGHGQVEHRGG